MLKKVCGLSRYAFSRVGLRLVVGRFNYERISIDRYWVFLGNSQLQSTAWVVRQWTLTWLAIKRWELWKSWCPCPLQKTMIRFYLGWMVIWEVRFGNKAKGKFHRTGTCLRLLQNQLNISFFFRRKMLLWSTSFKILLKWIVFRRSLDFFFTNHFCPQFLMSG